MMMTKKKKGKKTLVINASDNEISPLFFRCLSANYSMISSLIGVSLFSVSSKCISFQRGNGWRKLRKVLQTKRKKAKEKDIKSIMILLFFSFSRQSLLLTKGNPDQTSFYTHTHAHVERKSKKTDESILMKCFTYFSSQQQHKPHPRTNYLVQTTTQVTCLKVCWIGHHRMSPATRRWPRPRPSPPWCVTVRSRISYMDTPNPIQPASAFSCERTSNHLLKHICQSSKVS